jgi:hypothetical protein
VTGVAGQASPEYAGLLGVAAVLGVTLALIAGPPLVGAIRNAVVAALTGSPPHSARGAASAADIADVQAALSARDDAVSPDAALLGLAQRHGRARAAEVSGALLLGAALDAAPWIRGPRTYRAWKHIADGPYEENAATTGGDRDVENPTALPAAAWITVAEQRRALASLFAHHTSVEAVALDALPDLGALKVMRGARRLTRMAVSRLPGAVDGAIAASQVIDLISSRDEGIPPGARAGDIVVAWPAHRTFWRNGREDPSPLVDLGDAFGRRPAPRDYLHILYFRPGPNGLRVIGEAFRA